MKVVRLVRSWLTVCLVVILGFIYFALPSSAAVPETTAEAQTVARLQEMVKDRRQAFLETRMDLVRRANEAKQRISDLAKAEKTGTQSAETLRRDLNTIREAQRVLATIISDISNVASGSESGGQTGIQASASASPSSNSPDKPDTAGGAGSAGTAGDEGKPLIHAPAQNQKADENFQSREYLEKLVALYDAKTQQLAKVAESLNSIALIM